MRNQLFWRRPVDESAIAQAMGAWGVSRWAAEFYVRRGVESREALSALDATLPLSNPLELPDMDKAVWLIQRALSSGQRIRVYGDYDADGVTATAVLVRGLRMMGFGERVDYYIPNRFDEGYGLNLDAVMKAHADGIGLLVTVDCGSSSPESADLAESLGLNLVVTDHHALPSRLPNALALVNPELKQPVDRLSGAGVALQLVRALLRDEVPEVLYGIAALGTVADVVPLLGNNRRLVRRGLSALQGSQVAGVSAIYAVEGRDIGVASASDLGFLVGPRLNAAGRMGNADAAVEVLLTDNPDVARDRAVELSALNHERRDIQERMIAEAWERLPVDADGHLYPFAVIAGEDWHQGVIGIVAGRFREWLRRPTAVIAWEGLQGKGSARGTDHLNLIEHLRRSGDLFSNLGGHPGAAGFSLPRQSADRLSAILSEGLPPAVLSQQYRGFEFDMAVEGRGSGDSLWSELERMEPFGKEFQAPRFLVSGTVAACSAMGSEQQHLSLKLKDHDVRAVAFGWGPRAQGLEAGDPVRFLAALEPNWYRGRRTLQWRVDVLDGPHPRRPVPIRRGQPDPMPRRVLWIVDSDRAVRESSAASSVVKGYEVSRPAGELVWLEQQARRGLVEQIAVSQWRRWPDLLDWADAVIWLCRPRNQKSWEESAALARADGSVWWAAETVRTAVKARRLTVSRDTLGHHWRSWQGGKSGLMPGRAVFQELDLDPARLAPGVRRPLESSFRYRMALRDQQWDLHRPFESGIRGEEETNGVD